LILYVFSEIIRRTALVGKAGESTILERTIITAGGGFSRGRGVAFWGWEGFSADNGAQAAAAFSFYFFLSIIALLIFSGAVLGTVLKGDPQLLQRLIDYIAENAPGISDTISDALNASIDLRGVLGIAGFLGLLYTGSKVVDSLQVWLSEMWGMEKPRYLRKKIKSLLSLLVLGSIGGMGIGIHIAFVLVSERLHWPNAFAGILVFIITSSIIFFALSFIYSFAVDKKLDFKGVWKGALFVALLANPMQMILVWYYSNLGNFSAIYGSFAGIVLTILVIYYLGYIIFLGAELNHYTDKKVEDEGAREEEISRA